MKTVYLFCLVTGSRNSRHSSSNSRNKISRRFVIYHRLPVSPTLGNGDLPPKLAQVSCCPVNRITGPGTALLVEHPTEKPGAILTRVRVPGAAKDFPPRVNFQCILTYNLLQPSHASTSVGTLKIRNASSHAIVWTLGNITHTDRNG